MKHFKLNLELRGVIMVLAFGVLLPVMLSTAAGIVALVMAHNVGGVVTGVLVLSFAVAAAGSALVAVVMAGRKARLARLQSDFVANVSHELRTPLSAIKLYAQSLQSDKVQSDPERMMKCTATILREIEWMDIMIDKVLTWRASSRDMLALDMADRPVEGTVRRAVERFLTMVEPDTLTFACRIDSQLPVNHDVTALTAVLINVLTNAYKYTGENKQIDITVHDEGQAVVIDVKDNGIGLAANEAKHVFESFYRIVHENATPVSGVGLGLAISRHLLNQHRGTISVRSELGVGSTFTVRLPAALEDA